MQLSYFYNLPLPSQLAAPIQILHTAHALAAQGVSVTVYLNQLADSPEACLARYGLASHPGLRLVPLFGGLRARLTLGRRLRQIAEAAPPGRHVIMSRGETGVALFARLRGRRKRPEERYVYEAHRLVFTEATHLTWRVRAHERWAVETADGLVCLTEGVATALAQAFRPTAPQLILPSGTSFPDQVHAGDEGRDIDIIYVGKLERRKGVFDLVNALSLLPGRRLWLVGGGDEAVEQLRQHARALGVAERLVCPGFVEPGHLGELYRRARVGVCPLPLGESQIAEQFTSPLKVLELMAQHVPVVGTDLPSLHTLIAHAQTGLLARPSDPVSLAQAIGALLDDRERAHRLAAAAYTFCRQFAWEQRARRLATFLAQLP